MTSRGRLAAHLALGWMLVAGCLGFPGAAPAQSAGEIARYFRVEWQPEPVPRAGWALEGIVYSTHEYRVGSVRLRVDILNASGEIEARAYGYVQGDILPGGRRYFFVPLPQKGTSYRVTVVSFAPIARGAP